MDNNQNNFYQQQGSVGQVESVAPKKNTGLIVGVVIGIIVLVGIFTTMNSNNGKKIDGKWTCTGTSGNLTIDANEKEGTVKMQLGVYSVDAKYKVSSKVKPSKKKDGYKYIQYLFTSGSNSVGGTYSTNNKVGFIFGIDPKDSNKAHYIDSTKSTALEFNCTKAS